MTRLHLATENTFHAGYLVSRWSRAQPDLAGEILIRDDRPDTALRHARDEFHTRFAGQRQLPDSAWGQLTDLYPDLGDTDRAMVACFGMPERSVTYRPDTVYLGRNLNSSAYRDWVHTQWTVSPEAQPYLFVYLDRIFEGWWIEETGRRILNGHTAVLPYARGMHTIEQIAAARDADLFTTSAGATVHFIEEQVDTGPIVRASRLASPLRYESIWECKARSLSLAFDLLVDVASEIADGASTPVGLPPQAPSRSVEFRRRQFTTETADAAVAGYREMREAAERARRHMVAVGG